VPERELEPQPPARAQPAPGKPEAEVSGAQAEATLRLQRLAGNRAVSRLLDEGPAQPGNPIPKPIADAIDASRGGGQPLDGAARERIEPVLDHDLGGVKVHTSPEADTLAEALGARAFTTGNDIFFRGAQYSPHTPEGLALIAHESAHVAQQQAPSPGQTLELSPPDDVYEQDAEAVSREVAG
jgi:hypothetical protein